MADCGAVFCEKVGVVGVLGGCQWGCGVVGVGGVDVDGVEAKDGGGELADGGGDVFGGADVVELVGFFERELSGESIWVVAVGVPEVVVYGEATVRVGEGVVGGAESEAEAGTY